MSEAYELANPNPEYLIKSIAEQGYTLETALADLMDNSISANADCIEVITDLQSNPFRLFLADNGKGMSSDELSNNMRFPSKSPENTRNNDDLGRFGLGLKTASFSQTRCFTVLSREEGKTRYNGLSWDVDYLKEVKEWRIKIPNDEEIESLVNEFESLSSSYLNQTINFKPNTIIIWNGLYKYEDYLNPKQRNNALTSEIENNVVDHLSIVFHRFLQRQPNNLRIRINNQIVEPFNPFPNRLRKTDPLIPEFRNETVKLSGFVLPHTSIKESKELKNDWTPKNRSLIDMEGIYVYRADRLILYGGWNSIIKKAPRLQLARLKVEIGNQQDHLFHLNVAKSQIDIPFDLKTAFYRAVIALKQEAQKEFHNYGLRKISSKKIVSKSQLFQKNATNRGVMLVVNEEFHLLKDLRKSLDKTQKASLNIILRLANNMINKVRQQDQIELLETDHDSNLSMEEVLLTVKALLSNGLSKEQIRKDILPGLNINISQNETLKTLLK
jgi:hypothetical protein